MKPYYQDEWVTIYHLTNAPTYVNISSGYCMEVYIWDKEKAISKHKHTLTKGKGLGKTTTHTKAMTSLSNQAEQERYVATLLSPVKSVVIGWLKDTTGTAMPETIVQRMSSSCVADAICLRMGD